MLAMRLPQKFVKGDGNLNVNVKKNSICRFCGVNFTSGEGRASFENLFSPSGRVESAGLTLAHLLWLYWVAINQKQKLVRMGLQTLWSQYYKRSSTVQFHQESCKQHYCRGRFTLRGCGRSKQKTASHHYHARENRCKKETS